MICPTRHNNAFFFFALQVSGFPAGLQPSQGLWWGREAQIIPPPQSLLCRPVMIPPVWRRKDDMETKMHQLVKDNFYFKLWKFSLVHYVVEILLSECSPGQKCKRGLKCCLLVFFGRDTGRCCPRGWQLWAAGSDFGESQSKPTHFQQYCSRQKKTICNDFMTVISYTP